MAFSETHLQFLHLVERLGKINWGRQFKEVRPPEFFALTTLARYHREHPQVPGLYVSEFASRLGVPLPSASKLLKEMEQQGWLQRSVDPQNRRNTFVTLTDAGWALLDREETSCAAVGDHLFEQMGPESTAALLKELSRLIDLVEVELGTK